MSSLADYYPFGLAMEGRGNQDTTVYRYGFNGMERDDEWKGEGRSYDFGARIYDPKVGRWLSVDPLADKYPSISPFAFVTNSPLRFIDPDGRKVVFAEGVSDEFKKQFSEAVKILNKYGLGGMLAKLHASDVEYYIDEGRNVGTFDYQTRTIKWDPKMGVITNEGQLLSPITVFNHEVDHALQFDTKPDQYFKYRGEKDLDYKNLEEKRVITGSEQKTAKKLGEIKEGEVTRKDHEGSPIRTKGGLSTELEDD
ncbi:RHS repeat-associated core domain-containing protein [Litoribacter ruber]|uniref:RHS repeat domain-containing protein n=1 Tax=Litoribacter ruber TaxID=702568 RepID=UPI001BDB3874|nr:RHS repeat-associated core domain-containing protein [Litoribacter ruber]MBT0813143.1 RHS repeat-associated core domain-containing protein [Litoribacter ruber]